jgi:hypothetical protein
MTYIQFYSYTWQNWDRLERRKTLLLNNGFSSVWNFIKNDGNIIWVDPTKLEFPDVSGPVYISCSFLEEFDYIKKWVITRPDIFFIVGGPIVIRTKVSLPYPNFIADPRQLYETFNIEPKIDLWNLEIPKELDFEDVKYTYSFSTKACYWGKCTFCPDNKDWGGKVLDLGEIPVIMPGHNIVWINSLAITPKEIIKIFPTLSSESVYNFFLRGDSVVLKALKDVSIIPTLHPSIGVEFPSNRMLKFMNKGTTIDILTKVILKFLENGSAVCLNLILGWPNLVESDINEAKEFLKKLSLFKNNVILNTSLLVSFVKDDNTISRINNLNKVFYTYNLNREQKKLNDRVLNLYRNFNSVNVYDDFKKFNLDKDTIFK